MPAKSFAGTGCSAMVNPAGVSLMMIVEVPNLFQLDRISENGISHLADNVILLQYVQEGSELSRGLTVLKSPITLKWSSAWPL